MTEQTLFTAALERLPAERSAFLDQACGSNAELRQRVEKLLQLHDQAGSFLESPAGDPAATLDEPIAEKEGTQIGPYKLLEQIGEGGFGLVFVAEQQHPVRRRVALKIIKPGMDTREVIARFEAERQALALMDHPNIATILDAGTTDSGRPYFVMELVRGIPIVTYCDQKQLTTRERLELFVSVCLAVQHAHAKGVIHRDLKPSNILVAPHDGIPVVKIIDFGVAKAIGQQLTDKTVYTRFMQMIGTPAYMSPEQAEVNALDVDTRSDVYSLGVLLYEMLTGTTPLDGKRLASAVLDEIRRIIREEEPPKPSTRLTTLGELLPMVSARRNTEPAKLASQVRGDLDWIVMKSLEKDRRRRYDTASGMAEDVQRFLKHEPIKARPPSLAYRARKYLRRNRVAVSWSTAAAVAIVGCVVTWWLAKDSQPTLARALELKSFAWQAREAADYSTAASAYEELLDAQKRLLGPDHRETLITMRDLAWMYAKAQRREEAVDHSLDALSAHRRALGDEASETREAGWASFFCTGWWCEELAASSDDSPKKLNRDLAMVRRLNETRSTIPFQRAVVSAAEAWVEYRRGNFHRAVELAEGPGLTWPQPSWAMLLLARCYAKDGDQSRARDWYCAAWEINVELSPDIDNTKFMQVAKETSAELYGAEPVPSAGTPSAFVKVYDRLIAGHPENAALYYRRGLCHARLGDWDQASADLRKSWEMQPEWDWSWYHWGLISLYRGDEKAYQETCRGMLTRFGYAKENGKTVVDFNDPLVLLCSLGPSSGVDPNELLRAPNAGVIRGRLLYRSGQFQAAAKDLSQQTDAGYVFVGPGNRLFLAMAEQKLGHAARARELLAETRKAVSSKFPSRDPATKYYPFERTLHWLEVEILLREAESLIEPPGDTAQAAQ